jgi:hypothetical protein
VGPQRRSGRFPEEINMLLLTGIERRFPGHYPVADYYNRGVQIEGLREPHFMRKVRNLTCVNKTEGSFLFGRILFLFITLQIG